MHARDLSRLILGHFGHGITDFDIQGMTQRSRDHALASRPRGVPLYKVYNHSFVRDDDRQNFRPGLSAPGTGDPA